MVKGKPSSELATAGFCRTGFRITAHLSKLRLAQAAFGRAVLARAALAQAALPRASLAQAAPLSPGPPSALLEKTYPSSKSWCLSWRQPKVDGSTALWTVYRQRCDDELRDGLERRIDGVFYEFDANGNGLLSYGEFEELLRQISPQVITRPHRL